MSMFPSLEIGQRQELVRVGGATSCIFAHTYALLEEHPEYGPVLEQLAELEVTVEYRSLIDLLFFELYPEWKPVRNWFYSQDGELPLSGYIGQRDINRYDGALMLALEIARQRQGEECMRSWRAFRRVFCEEFARHVH